MTEMYKKYMKYKIKYLHLINNINGGAGSTPIKRTYFLSETPEFPSSSRNVLENFQELN
jgi:hypothetical protein